jgi:acyl-CoA oxidase
MMSSASNFMKYMYVKRTPEASKAIHVYSSALKATLTWQNMTTLQVLLKCYEYICFHAWISGSHWIFFHFCQECREACGGQGLKTDSRVGILKAEFDVQSTFEGDNNVLLQQVILTSCCSSFMHVF